MEALFPKSAKKIVYIFLSFSGGLINIQIGPGIQNFRNISSKNVQNHLCLKYIFGGGWFFKQSHEIPYFRHGYKDIKNYDDRYQIQNFRNISSKYVQNHLCLKYTFGGGWENLDSTVSTGQLEQKMTLFAIFRDIPGGTDDRKIVKNQSHLAKFGCGNGAILVKLKKERKNNYKL